jgi:TolA-binding protein
MRTSHDRHFIRRALRRPDLPRIQLPIAACVALTLALVTFAVPGGHPVAAAETAKRAATSHPSLNQAKRLIDAGQAEEAITILRRFLGTNPKPEFLDDTYLLLGAALYRGQQYPEALKYLQQLQTEFPSSEVIDRGKLMLARTHAAMGNRTM